MEHNTFLKTLIVGYGNQGKKRQLSLGNDFVGSVDPYDSSAIYQDIKEVPLESFEAAILCTPDSEKLNILRYLVDNRKHVIVEKPLLVNSPNIFKEIEHEAIRNKVVVITGYNHRFEPGFIKIRECLSGGVLGNIYSVRCFYGNGTARLNRNSRWKDKGNGVIDDLGSHLLDTISFWFPNDKIRNYNLVSSNCFENASPDHAVIASVDLVPRIELEMTLLMWKNTFTCDVVGEKGSIHMDGLCKWGRALLP